MLLIDPQGNYPRYVGDLLLANPSWKEAQPLPEGWIIVNPSEIPSHNMATHKLEELHPALAEDGQYYQSWSLSEITLSESEIREKLLSMGLPEELV
jgi:hypothetical protein